MDDGAGRGKSRAGMGTTRRPCAAVADKPATAVGPWSSGPARDAKLHARSGAGADVSVVGEAVRQPMETGAGKWRLQNKEEGCGAHGVIGSRGAA